MTSNFFHPLIQSLAGRRLILHAGTPKTGTTSIQHWLYKKKPWLLQNGIVYPSNVLSPQEPKHQWLVEAHRSHGADLLNTQCQTIEKELKRSEYASASSVLLSAEGLSNHFFELILPKRDAWAELAKACRLKVIITFRDPFQYALSRYRQNLLNPPSSNRYHATALSLDQICTDPLWLRSLNYHQLTEFWGELIDNDSLICLPYKKDIIDSFRRFGLDLDSPPDSNDQERCNISIESIGVRLIRELNAMGISGEERWHAIRHIRAAEASLQNQNQPFAHSEYSHRTVRSFCQSCLPPLLAKHPELSMELKDAINVRGEGSTDQRSDQELLTNQSIAFICCIEPGFLEEQVVRLAQSIRLFAGSHSRCPIYAVSPHGEVVSKKVQHQLESLSVTLITRKLNRELPHFAYANKAYAVEYVQSLHGYDAYVFLDSDTLFVDEPSALYLDDNVDLLARPVDLRNICSSPLDNAFQDYWHSCCQLAGIKLTDLPIILSSVDKQAIRANWNGGLLMFRGNIEIGALWRQLIEDMWRQQILAKPNNFWGSGQVSFALAACRLNMRGVSLSDEYNIPLHLPAEEIDINRIERPRHVHYHWLFDSDYQQEWSQKLANLRLRELTRKIIEAMPTSKQKTKRNITGFNFSP